MLELAFVGSGFKAQVRANPTALSGVEVVWRSQSLPLLSKQVKEPTVVVCRLTELGDEPRKAVEALTANPSVKRVVVIYNFASQRRLAEVELKKVRLVRGPVSLGNLRVHLVDLIVDNILSEDKNAEKQGLTCPACGYHLSGPMGS